MTALLEIEDHDRLRVLRLNRPERKNALTEQLAMMEAIRAPVAAAKAEGKSLEEVLAMKPSAAYDERWSSGRWTGDAIVTALYEAVE